MKGLNISPYKPNTLLASRSGGAGSPAYRSYWRKQVVLFSATYRLGRFLLDQGLEFGYRLIFSGSH
jgi:hypothetical protein